jgi:acyl dehydratase
MSRLEVSREIVGCQLDPIEFEWKERDAILYALGIGARPPEDLDFLYEARGPRVLPTFALIPNWYAVRGLGQRIDTKGCTVVHAEQQLELARPLPARGKVEARAWIAGAWDKGKSSLIELAAEARDGHGPLFSTRSAVMILGLGGWGGERGPAGASAEPATRTPDLVLREEVRPEQAAIYRLSGDLNPLHIDPERAKAAGFDGVFIHGLCTLGIAGRALLGPVCAGDPDALVSLGARFAQPVYPGEPLEIHVWRTASDSFEFSAAQAGRAVLTRGHARGRSA